MEFLFERLEALPRQQDPAQRLREAIRRQLQWLVGSREWRAEQEGAGMLEVAMPELPTLAADAARVRRYASRLTRLIERHEPRLKRPRVELHATGRTLAPFTVVVLGVLDVGEHGESLRFEYEPGPRDAR